MRCSPSWPEGRLLHRRLTALVKPEFATSDIYLDAFHAGLLPDPLQTVDQWLDAENVQLPSFVS